LRSIEVAAWSDNPVPREGESLAKDDRKLAQERIRTIKKYLKDSLQVGDVDDTTWPNERIGSPALSRRRMRSLNKSWLERRADVSRGISDHQGTGEPSKAVVLVLLKQQ